MRKKILLSIVAVIFLGLIFMLFKNEMLTYRKLIKASVIETEENLVIIDAAKKMINDNMSKYDNKTTKINIKKLIEKKYLNGSVLKQTEYKNISEDDYVYIEVKNKEIINAYIKSKYLKDYLLNKKQTENYIFEDNYYYFKGLSNDNYVMINNELYRIVKVGSSGEIYIVSNSKEKRLAESEIDSYLISLKQTLNSNLVKKITNLTLDDYTKANFNDQNYLNQEYSFYVKTYDSYEIVNNIDDFDIAYVKSLIQIDKDVHLEKGNGTLVDPFIVSE